jgi:cytochrome oxidase assembly protein ShyY1
VSLAGAVRRRGGVLWPSLFALGAFGVLIGLGTWQLERKAWKEGLIAMLDQRLTAAPVALPAHVRWASLDPAQDEFRRVSVRVQFLGEREGRVYTSGSGLREDIKGPGYFAFAPARLADGSIVVVNRGYVSNPLPNASLRPIALREGAVDIIGVMRWPEPPGWFVTAHDAAADLWFVRDHRAMAAAYDWGAVAPFYIDQESPVPEGGVPRPAPLKVNLRNEHLQYAMVWYGLAAVLVVSFAFLIVGRRREISASETRSH